MTKHGAAARSRASEDQARSAPRKCACNGGCDRGATDTDDGGNPVCRECISYWVDVGGECHCLACEGGVVCPDCHKSPEMGGIMTGDPGSGQSNYRLGTCECDGRTWTETEGGGAWDAISYADEENEEEEEY